VFYVNMIGGERYAQSQVRRKTKETGPQKTANKRCRPKREKEQIMLLLLFFSAVFQAYFPSRRVRLSRLGLVLPSHPTWWSQAPLGGLRLRGSGLGCCFASLFLNVPGGAYGSAFCQLNTCEMKSFDSLPKRAYPQR